MGEAKDGITSGETMAVKTVSKVKMKRFLVVRTTTGMVKRKPVTIVTEIELDAVDATDAQQQAADLFAHEKTEATFQVTTCARGTLIQNAAASAGCKSASAKSRRVG